jgi:hypothetical protein
VHWPEGPRGLWAGGGGVPALVRGQKHPAHREAEQAALLLRHSSSIQAGSACCLDWAGDGRDDRGKPRLSRQGPRHSVMKGSTGVMSSPDASALLQSIDMAHVVGLRDRVFTAAMVDAFARVSAVVGLNVEDYLPLKKRWWLRLHERAARLVKWAATTNRMHSGTDICNTASP